MKPTTCVQKSPSEGVDVCLISAGLPSSNPRLVKEAQALVNAGYRVHCVVGDYPTPLRDYDAELIARTGATMKRVGLGSHLSYKLRRAMQETCRFLSRGLSLDSVLVRAVSPQSLRLFREAAGISARLYIGHTLPALPAAVMAAQYRGAIAGFDAEDCHSVETYERDRNRVAGLVERTYLPRCRHLTASSPLIAAEYRSLYGLSMTPLLNVFDAPESVDMDGRRAERRGPFSLYWFSQTIGPGRGLEQVILGAARAESAFQLCLRGTVSEGYRQELVTLGRVNGLRTELQFLPPAHPDVMIEKAAEHDAGLSLELRTPPNHNLALSNKMFTYLAAGIPQIVSHTDAQAEVARELGDAAILVDLDNPAQIAAAIDRLAGNLETCLAASAEARRLYRDRFSWKIESASLIDAVQKVVPRSGTPLMHCQQLPAGAVVS